MRNRIFTFIIRFLNMYCWLVHWMPFIFIRQVMVMPVILFFVSSCLKN